MDLKDLYREVILDHNKSPRQFGRLEPAARSADVTTTAHAPSVSRQKSNNRSGAEIMRAAR
jgi:NifU-like protein involved in Fe-S cluster formation